MNSNLTSHYIHFVETYSFIVKSLQTENILVYKSNIFEHLSYLKRLENTELENVTKKTL